VEDCEEGAQYSISIYVICRSRYAIIYSKGTMVSTMKPPIKPDGQYGPTGCKCAIERPYYEATWQVGRLDKNPCRDLNPNSDTVGEW
jgi:hypothetical protein